MTTTPPPHRTSFPLHPPPTDFTGRATELVELDQAVRQEHISILSLHGMGGIGKSALALMLADWLHPLYPDGQLLVPLHGSRPDPVPSTVALTRLLQPFYPGEQIGDELSILRERYLAALQGKRIIILLEDARDLTHIEPFLPPPAGCLVIITTRNQFMVRSAHSLNLASLTRKDSLTFLRAMLKKSLSKPHLQELASLCGDLPLALEIAAGALYTRPDQIHHLFLKRLALENKRLSHFKKVEASLRLSYDLLGDPALQARFRTLGVFPSDFDKCALAAVWGGTPDAPTIQDGISALITASLVRWDAERQRYSLHDLVRLFALNEMSATELELAAYRHASYFWRVLGEADILYQKGGQGILTGLQLFDCERANIEASQAWAATNAPSIPRAAKLCHRFPSVGWYILHLRLHPRIHIAWLEEALEYTQQLRHRALEGTYLGHLGIAYLHLGEAERSLPYHKQRLAIAREIGDQRMEGLAQANLGLAHLALGNTDKARICHRKHLVIARRSGDQRGQGMALGNLGLIFQAEGYYAQALACYREHWTLAHANHDHCSMATAVRNLGTLAFQIGKVKWSILLHEIALSMSNQIGDWRGEGHALGSLGKAYLKLGILDRAIHYYEERLKLAPKTGDRRSEASTLNNLGTIYLKRGEVQKANEHYMQSLTLTLETKSQQNMATALWGIAKCQAKMSNYTDAVAQAEQALTLFYQLGADQAAAKVRPSLSRWRQLADGGMG